MSKKMNPKPELNNPIEYYEALLAALVIQSRNDRCHLLYDEIVMQKWETEQAMNDMRNIRWGIQS